MGTIQQRTRRDGSTSYTATVRVKRGGKVLLCLTETFSREPAARAWVAKKEAEAAKPGGIERLTAVQQGGATLAEAIDRYTATSLKTMGRTKAQVLRAIAANEIAAMDCSRITSEALVSYAQRLAVSRQPQTVANSLSHLQSVFAIARAAWGRPLDPQANRLSPTI